MLIDALSIPCRYSDGRERRSCVVYRWSRYPATSWRFLLLWKATRSEVPSSYRCTRSVLWPTNRIFLTVRSAVFRSEKRFDRFSLILSAEFREDTYTQRLFLFQEAIVQRFGFVPCLVEGTETDHQYVHVTGNAFVLVPSTPCIRPRPRTDTNIIRRITGQKRYPVHPDQSSPHEAYITRHVSGKNKDNYSMDRRVGIVLLLLLLLLF